MADGISFNVDEIMRNLDLTQNKLNTGINKVLKESAEPLKDQIESTTNRSDGSTHRYGEGHAADKVIISSVKGGRSDEKSVDVGYEKAVAWRMYFVEFGTVKQKPQGIIRNSVSVKKGDVLKIQQAGLRGLLGT